MNLSNRKILLKKEVKEIIRINSDSAFQELINSGQFPKGFRLGMRLLGWFEDEIEEWLINRVAERDAKS
ncbi:transcriptional regulator [Rahnella sp. AA]|uniref:helix-turn-helix transcriptional regulator n=1 Tax=Rahnella sp. AA TaxID=2057180 RepID=UPI000C32E510|nr:AlpA family phage regulatory protein [Rahnella sp. AA]PKE32918.1 transcriptional regulator [Rahnella sp. AA]